jgi:hypothetical protein
MSTIVLPIIFVKLIIVFSNTVIVFNSNYLKGIPEKDFAQKTIKTL